jgi:hypothetical protein
VARKRLTWFRLCTDYHQFYLLDEGIKPPAPDDYNDPDVLPQRLLVRPHIIAVMTFQPNTFSAAVEVLDAEPAVELDAWDHVVDASLELPTGKFAVDTCLNRVAKRQRVAPGWYRVRVCAGGMAGWEAVPEGQDPPERFRISLWLGEAAPVRVRKQWAGPVSV